MLTEEDAAVAAGAEPLEDLVFADREAAISAVQQFLGLKISQKAVTDEKVSEFLGVGGDCGQGGQLPEIAIESKLLDQAAFADQLQEGITRERCCHRSTSVLRMQSEG